MLTRPGPMILALAATALALALAAVAGLLRRLSVEGPSMLPTLYPGDRLLAVRLPFAWPLRVGDLVVLWDPHGGPDGGRLVVKRVAGVVDRGAGIEVRGDNPPASTDSRTYGPVDRHLVLGRVVYRYGPAERAGWLGRARWRRGKADWAEPGGRVG
jgi:nickel-type superoxide dismutase maturation protease